MSYNLKEPNTFINIKLTSVGREMLSLGRLNFSNAILSDREVNYNIDPSNRRYDIINNRILSPFDFHPEFDNYDGLQFVSLSGGSSNGFVGSRRLSTTACTETAGFFTGSTDNFGIRPSKTLIGLENCTFTANTITYSTFLPSGGTEITLDNPAGSYFPNDGDLMYIQWEPIQNSGNTPAVSTSHFITSGNPTNALWYRVVSGSTPTITVDRPTPDFGTTSTSQKLNVYFYPFSGIDTYYGTASTVDAGVWNMNVVKTSSVPGSTTDSVYDYISYGSIEFNGTKQYFGLTETLDSIGILHYTNEFTGNTYAERLVPGSVTINVPNIMWHNNGESNGQGKKMGVTLYDSTTLVSDSFARTNYSELRDGTTANDKVVGRVYHDLKTIIITHQELLAAMTYKANRSYTLPGLKLQTQSSPKSPLTTSQATGLIKDKKTYAVTYIVESESSYQDGVSFGYGQGLHCADVKLLEGSTDSNGNTQYLEASFEEFFPFMRNSSNMDASSSFSGTGWNGNKVQLLVNEFDTDDELDLGTLSPDNWKRISTTVGNGIYTGDTGDTTIDPLKLAGHKFVVSQEDYDSGTTYSLDTMFKTGITSLDFGNESFFYGNIDACIEAVCYRTEIFVPVLPERFNVSVENNSFEDSPFEGVPGDNFGRSATYITEVGVLDSDGNLVAVGKPTYPIRKSSGRYLQFNLEIDF